MLGIFSGKVRRLQNWIADSNICFRQSILQFRKPASLLLTIVSLSDPVLDSPAFLWVWDPIPFAFVLVHRRRNTRGAVVIITRHAWWWFNGFWSDFVRCWWILTCYWILQINLDPSGLRLWRRPSSGVLEGRKAMCRNVWWVLYSEYALSRVVIWYSFLGWRRTLLTGF